MAGRQRGILVPDAGRNGSPSTPKRRAQYFLKLARTRGRRDGEIRRANPARELFHRHRYRWPACRTISRNVRNWVGVRIAACGHPPPHEILVQRFRRRPLRKSFGIAGSQPISAAVGGMDLVGQDDRTIFVEAEFVLGIDQDQSPPGGDLAPAGEQGHGLVRHLLPLPLGQQLARKNVPRAERRIMRAVLRLGGGRDDGARKLLVVAQAVGEPVAIHLALALFIHLQDGGGRRAGQIVAHHDLDRHHRQPLAHQDVGIRIRNDVIGAEALRRLEPEARGRVSTP